MIEQRMIEIEEEISLLTKEILVALRPRKIIKEDSFLQLYKLLEELKYLIAGKEFIRRKLAGLLFFLFKSLISEANHTSDPELILNEAWRINGYLLDIYDDTITQKL